MSKHKNFISAVVYLSNAEGVIGDFLRKLHGVLSENFEKFEIICANDASSDGSADVVRGIAGSFDNCTLSILNMSYYQGVEAAMHAGVDLAIGDFVFEFDSTVMDYPPELIAQVYDRSIQGFDIVSCGSARARVSSRLFYRIYNRHSGTQHELNSETFRVISRRAVNRVHSMSVNLPYRKALYANCGLKSDFIRYEPAGAEGRKQPQTLKAPYDTALTALILFTDVAYKAALTFTVIMMLATLAAVGYVVTIYVLGNPVEGYTTTMLFVSGAFFAMFALMSVIIKYLSVISSLIFNKQRYIIESIEKPGA